jgi:hypothetical protein
MHEAILIARAFMDLSQIPQIRHLHFFGAKYCTMDVNLGLFGLFLAISPIFGRPT